MPRVRGQSSSGKCDHALMCCLPVRTTSVYIAIWLTNVLVSWQLCEQVTGK